MVRSNEGSVAADFAGLPLQGNRQIGLVMTQAMTSPIEVFAQIAVEKTKGAKCLPLADMNEFMAHKAS